MRTYKIIKVEWEDCQSVTGWLNHKNVRKIGGERVFAAGLQVPAQRGYIGVTNLLDPCDVPRVGDTVIIPRKMIKGKIEVLHTFKA